MIKTKLFLPIILFVIFFVIQSTMGASEIVLTGVVLLFTLLILFFGFGKNEYLLFTIGLVAGLFIEVFLGLFGRQQHWENASLFNVPFWLPIVWGVGFVLINRIGNAISNKS